MMKDAFLIIQLAPRFSFPFLLLFYDVVRIWFVIIIAFSFFIQYYTLAIKFVISRRCLDLGGQIQISRIFFIFISFHKTPHLTKNPEHPCQSMVLIHRRKSSSVWQLIYKWAQARVRTAMSMDKISSCNVSYNKAYY